MSKKKLTEDQRKTLSIAMKKAMNSEEVKEKLRLANKGKKLSEETKRKISRTKSGMKQTEEHRKNNSKSCKKKWENPEYRKSQTEALKRGWTIDSKEKMSISKKKNWQDPEYVKKQMKVRNVTPNKTELRFEDFLNDLFPNEYKFVGDGELIIAGKCPDFVNINGQKKIIELYGDYWHRGQDPQDRIDIFKPFGYQTLVIWESELKDIDKLKGRLMEFNKKEASRI